MHGAEWAAYAVKLGGTAEVIASVPMEIINRSRCDRSFLLLREPNSLKGANVMSTEKIPYKIYLTEEELPKA